jgi:hypothetical protein
MEVSMCEIIRETRNAINARLDMLELLISKHSNYQFPNDCNVLSNYQFVSSNNTNQCDNHRIDYLNNKINSLSDKVLDIETLLNNFQKKFDLNEKVPELIIQEDKEENKDLNTSIKVQEEKEEVKEEEEEEVEEEEVEEAEEEEEEEEEVEEEEGLELEEFEYKGITLYRDPENKVYRMDEDGSISEPIGVWDESKQKIKKL